MLISENVLHLCICCVQQSSIVFSRPIFLQNTQCKSIYFRELLIILRLHYDSSRLMIMSELEGLLLSLSYNKEMDTQPNTPNHTTNTKPAYSNQLKPLLLMSCSTTNHDNHLLIIKEQPATNFHSQVCTLCNALNSILLHRSPRLLQHLFLHILTRIESCPAHQQQ